MITIEIMFNDLTADKQKEILDALDLKNPEEMNWNTFPITCLDFE